MTLKEGPTLPKGHQTWQMNEINKLIWPSASAGIGIMNKAAFDQTAKIAQQFEVISKAPSGRLPHRPRSEGRCEPEGAGRRRQRQGLQAADREADRSAASSDLRLGNRACRVRPVRFPYVRDGTRKEHLHVRADQGRPRDHRSRRLRRRRLHRGRAHHPDRRVARHAGRQDDRRDREVRPAWAASTRTRTSRCRGAARRRSTTSSRATPQPRSAARRRTSTSASRGRARASATRSRPGTRSARARR